MRRALIDPLPEVRQAAAQTFVHLHTNIGPRALEDILPKLLMKLEDEEVSEFALDGLQQVMAQRSHVVLPYLVPEVCGCMLICFAYILLICVQFSRINYRGIAYWLLRG